MDKKKRLKSQSNVYREMNCLERKIKKWFKSHRFANLFVTLK